MREKILLYAVIVIIAVAAASAVNVYAADEDLYKNLEDTAKESGNDYFIKYRDNYELDTEEMSFFKVEETGSVMMNMITSFVFLIQKLLAQLVIAIFSFALSNNINTILGQLIEPFIDAMKSGIWDNLAVYAISFAAFAILLKMVQSRTTQAMTSLMSIVLIIVLAFTFYSYPVEVMEGVDLVVTGISDEIMEGAYSQTVGGTTSDAKGKASSLCWDLFVHKPWQILEFGSVATAKKYQDDILKLEPGSKKRKDKVEKLAESDKLFSKSAGYQGSRLASSLIILLFNLILMAVIIAFSVLIIGYRFLLLGYILLGTLVFLVALVPEFGLPIVKRWGMRIISVSFIRVLVIFFLSLTMIFMDTIYGFIDTYGLLIVILLIIVIVAAIWFEKYRLINLFTSYRSNGSITQPINKALESDFNTIDKVRSIRKKAFDNSESSSNMVKTGRNRETESEEREGPKNQLLEKQQTVTKEDNTIKKSNSDLNGMKITGEKLQHSAESLYSVSQDMSLYFRQAEALLEKQYEYSKEKSEKAGADKNEPPEYDDFVKRTNKIREKGMENFDRKDIANVANIMKNTVKQGGSIDEVISDGTTIRRMNRPQSLEGVRRDSEKENTVYENRQEKGARGIQYFKENFGDEKGEVLYGKLQQQYGRETMEDYRPVYNNNGKQSYAQVLKQLNENTQQGNVHKPLENTSINHRSTAGRQPESRPVKPAEAITLREGVRINDEQ